MRTGVDLRRIGTVTACSVIECVAVTSPDMPMSRDWPNEPVLPLNADSSVAVTSREPIPFQSPTGSWLL